MRHFTNYLGLNLILVFSLFQFSTFAESVNYDMAKQAASNKISELNKTNQYSIIDFKRLYSDEDEMGLFYLFEIDPQGYIVVSADTDLPPVIAYSFTDSYNLESQDENPLIKLLLSDLKQRVKNIKNIDNNILVKRNTEWRVLLHTENVVKSSPTFEQWPPEGSTSTEGWLETNWTQNAPYNNFCPMDPVTGSRSIAGCPSVAMAMIVNYYATINQTVFSDADDYYHSYAGRNYWIDDDHEEQDFPSFPVLNAHLDTLVDCFTNQAPLKENDMAAITFACGVAATQVYTSSASGTFGVSQAFDAYMKFGFQDALLLTDSDTSFYTKLSQNMMDARPVHFAVVDPPVSMGHNVVVDGYNTNDYYHLNFGWGGAYNGWYLLPDEIPYGLTVIEGAILNIAYPPIYINTTENRSIRENLSLNVFPNPVTDFAEIKYSIAKSTYVVIEVFNNSGQLVQTLVNNNKTEGTYLYTWNLESNNGNKLSEGVYFCRLKVNNMFVSKKFIIAP